VLDRLTAGPGLACVLYGSLDQFLRHGLGHITTFKIWRMEPFLPHLLDGAEKMAWHKLGGYRCGFGKVRPCLDLEGLSSLEQGNDSAVSWGWMGLWAMVPVR